MGMGLGILVLPLSKWFESVVVVSVSCKLKTDCPLVFYLWSSLLSLPPPFPALDLLVPSCSLFIGGAARTLAVVSFALALGIFSFPTHLAHSNPTT